MDNTPPTKLKFRKCESSDVEQLAQWNHQLVRDEGHRSKMSVPEMTERMRGWVNGDYEAVVFELEESPVAYAVFRNQPDEIHLRQFLCCVATDDRESDGKRFHCYSPPSGRPANG